MLQKLVRRPAGYNPDQKGRDSLETNMRKVWKLTGANISYQRSEALKNSPTTPTALCCADKHQE